MDFFIENWKVLVMMLLILVTLLVCIFKKNVKISDSVLTLIISLLPGLIVEAEASLGAGNGADKLAFVLGAVMSFMKDKLGLDEKAISAYIPRVKSEIESILSTPQKKEGVIDEK